MSENLKKGLLIGVIIAAASVAVYFGTVATQPPKEEIVGTLPMPEGGGRDAEKNAGATNNAGASKDGIADQASGMPADKL